MRPEDHSWWEATNEGIRLRIRAQPGARRSEVVGAVDDHLKVRLAEPAVDDAANTELVVLLSRVCGIRRSAIRIVRGRRSRTKIVQIVGRHTPPSQLCPPE